MTNISIAGGKLFIGVLAPESLLRTQQTEFLVQAEREIGTIQEISRFESGWLAPESYVAEMGDYLSTLLVVFDGIWHPQNLAYAKSRTQKLEDFFRRPNGERLFNINPGMIDKENMRLASHKPSERRYELAKNVWVEVQMQWERNKLEPRDCTFQEYLMGSRHTMLSRLAHESVELAPRISPEIVRLAGTIGSGELVVAGN